MQEIILYNGEAEDLELRRLAYRVDARKNRAAREAAEARAQRAERTLRAERAKARKEKRELGAFLMVIALVVVMAVCVTAAPVWTAAFPFAGALLVMRKVGWLKNGGSFPDADRVRGGEAVQRMRGVPDLRRRAEPDAGGLEGDRPADKGTGGMQG